MIPSPCPQPKSLSPAHISIQSPHTSPRHPQCFDASTAARAEPLTGACNFGSSQICLKAALPNVVTAMPSPAHVPGTPCPPCQKPSELAQHVMSSCSGPRRWKAQHGDERSQGRERSLSSPHAEPWLSENQGGNTRQTGKICLYLMQLTPQDKGNVSGWASSSSPVGWGARGGAQPRGGWQALRLSSTKSKALNMEASAPTWEPHGDTSQCITQPWADSESPAPASGRRVSVSM